MKAVTWHGRRDLSVADVADPRIEEPTDAVVRVTSTNICGSDLHLYEVLGAFLEPGDILGHEPMGVVEDVGPQAGGHVQPGDRVVIPFNISCGHCWMCERGLQSQCETTQNYAQGKGGKLPPSLAEPIAKNFGIDRLNTLINSFYGVRRGGTVSLSGVYGGAVDPLPMVDMFDRQITVRMGQCNVKRWIDDIMPHLTDDSDPLGTEDLATHHLPLEQAPHGYEIFQKKQDGCIKVVLNPGS